MRGENEESSVPQVKEVLEKLRSGFEGQILSDDENLEDFASDIGRMSRARPSLVAIPEHPGDLIRLLETCRSEGVPLTFRGAGRSQGGQTLQPSGIVCDLCCFDSIEAPGEDSVWVGAGVTWRKLLEVGLKSGRLPQGLPDDLDGTVGGTVASGGLGAMSFRDGLTSDTVLELEVLSPDGHFLRASAAENEQLFDVVRCGMGQFGVITRTRIAWQAAAEQVRMTHFLYDEVATVIDDLAQSCAQEDGFEFLEARLVACPTGWHPVDGVALPTAHWIGVLHLGQSLDAQRAPAKCDFPKALRRLRVQDLDLESFLCRQDSQFDLWRSSGALGSPKPWVDLLIPLGQAVSFVTGVLSHFPTHLIGDGEIRLWPLPSRDKPSGVLRGPSGEALIGFGIRPLVAPAFLPLAKHLMSKITELARRIGGRQCPSGWISDPALFWPTQLGQEWRELNHLKQFYDSEQLLNPGLIPWGP